MRITTANVGVLNNMARLVPEDQIVKMGASIKDVDTVNCVVTFHMPSEALEKVRAFFKTPKEYGVNLANRVGLYQQGSGWYKIWSLDPEKKNEAIIGLIKIATAIVGVRMRNFGSQILAAKKASKTRLQTGLKRIVKVQYVRDPITGWYTAVATSDKLALIQSPEVQAKIEFDKAHSLSESIKLLMDVVVPKEVEFTRLLNFYKR